MRKTANFHQEQTTAQRFEAKYFLSEFQAEQFKHYIRPYTLPDKHVQFGQSYVINSLYLDNPRLEMFWSSVLGEKNRIKLRIRNYDEKPDSPVIFEIKRRVNQVIFKQRATMKSNCIQAVLKGEPIPPNSFVKPSPTEEHAFNQFQYYVDRMGASSRCFVRYKREPYMSALEEPVRITFDRNLTCLEAQNFDPQQWAYGPHWRRIDDVPVILEVKFTNHFPDWIRRAIMRFELMQVSYAKYITCMKALQREGSLFGRYPNPNEDPLWACTAKL